MPLPVQVRTKLAPIRGIPTKKGLQNPNQDILDIFAFWDAVPKLPQIVFGSLTSCKSRTTLVVAMKGQVCAMYDRTAANGVTAAWFCWGLLTCACIVVKLQQ